METMWAISQAAEHQPPHAHRIPNLCNRHTQRLNRANTSPEHCPPAPSHLPKGAEKGLCQLLSKNLKGGRQELVLVT